MTPPDEALRKLCRTKAGEEIKWPFRVSDGLFKITFSHPVDRFETVRNSRFLRKPFLASASQTRPEEVVDWYTNGEAIIYPADPNGSWRQLVLDMYQKF